MHQALQCFGFNSSVLCPVTIKSSVFGWISWESLQARMHLSFHHICPTVRHISSICTIGWVITGSSQECSSDHQAQPWKTAGLSLWYNTLMGEMVRKITCWQVQGAARSLGFRTHGDVIFRCVWAHWGCVVLGCRYTWYSLSWEGCSPHLYVDPHPTWLGETCQSRMDKKIYSFSVFFTLTNINWRCFFFF